MKHLTRRIVLAALLLTGTLRAQVPQLLNYQGRVAVGAVNFDGSGQFKFALVDATGTTTYWSNDGTGVGGAQPTAAVVLTVTKGLYSLLLGDLSLGAGMTAIPASVWTNAEVRLRVWFNDGANGFQLLTPDQRLAPTGYLADGSVSGTAIASGAVTSAKIADGAVTTTQLATNAVQATNLAPGSVDGTKIANVSIAAGNLADGAVTAAKILDGSVATAALAYDAASLSKVSGGNLTISSDRLFVTNGVIQRAGTPLTTTQDLGLYSQFSGSYMRFVTTDAPFHWFTDGGIGTTPRMSLTATGNLSLAGAFSATGEGTFGGAVSAPAVNITGAGGDVLFANNGQIRSFDNNHRILLRNSENKLELREFGDLIFSPGASAGAETAKVVMLANGKVGIGTSTPRSALEVNGDIRMSGPRTKLYYKGDNTDGSHTGSMGFYTSNGGLTAIMTPYDGNGAVLPTSTVSLGGFGSFESSVVNLKVSGEVTATVVTITGGSDVAEPYEVASAGEIAPIPGMVVAIDTEHIGQMRVAARAYDRTVAGILSGANGIAPGITLRQKGTVADGSLPVASIGRVWCLCDADANGAI